MINSTKILVEIKNSFLTKKKEISIKLHKENLPFLYFLKKKGFISGFSYESNVKKNIKIFLRYDNYLNPSLNAVKKTPKNQKINVVKRNNKSKNNNINSVFYMHYKNKKNCIITQ